MTIVYEVAGVAPMWPRAPCFATPIFRCELSNAIWYQNFASNGPIQSFQEVSDDVLDKCIWRTFPIRRELGQLPCFGYIADAVGIFVDEAKELKPVLRAEFMKHPTRPFLRHSIAKFIEDANLIGVAASEIRNVRRVRARDDFVVCFFSSAADGQEIAQQISGNLSRAITNMRMLVEEEITPSHNWDSTTGVGRWFYNVEDVRKAEVFILIVTPSFLSNDRVMKEELPTMIKQSAITGAPIIPVIAKECEWRNIQMNQPQVVPNFRPGVRLFADMGQRQDAVDRASEQVFAEISEHFGTRIQRRIVST